MPRIKLTLAYEGTHYYGWQKQVGHPSIQGQLETAVQKLTQQITRVHGAGRTDAGVHALAQVAHFDSAADFLETDWVRALNAVLPDDIVVNKAVFADENFHARFSAKGKRYRYRILNTKQADPFIRNQVWHVQDGLDLRAMQIAAKALSGAHCFTSFCAAETDVSDHDIDLNDIQIGQAGDEIRIVLNARRFLRYMVRNIVGFLVEVGRGRRTPEEIPSILAAKNRSAAGPTAPPQGLMLVQVDY